MTRLDPARETWMRDEDIVAVMEALEAHAGAARFVGGAVRNALLGEPVNDVDIATTFRPEDVMRRLEASHIKAVPTGLDHGTVTAVFPAHKFEITTLRRDVTTDGRHADVAFSQDWRLDAQRRDFTINALYASADGELFDFVGGANDIAARRVRFIGNPVERIREDYLRILRLFRFHAWYGRGEIDGDALAAARDERAGLRRLSGERIRNELLRLLEAADPGPALRAMSGADIFHEIAAGDWHVARLEGMISNDAAYSVSPDAILRLAALAPDPAFAASLADRLRLSSEARARLVDIAAAPEKVWPAMPVRDLRVLLYRLGAQKVRDRIRLRWADDTSGDAEDWQKLLELAETWQTPRFPVSGSDVVAAGLAEGPEVGKLLRELETWWIEQDFAPDRSELLERLNASASKIRH